MLYKEYQKSSIRHLKTCRHLMKSLGDASDRDKEHLIHNAYYLSGYVIETILSYALFRWKKWKQNEPIDSYLRANSQFKTHVLEKKIQYLRDQGFPLDGIDLIDAGCSSNHNKMMRRWCETARYQDPSRIDGTIVINYETLHEYLSKVESLQIKILEKVN